MKILAIDTSSPCGVVALGEDLNLIGEWHGDSHETHSARLLPAVGKLLSDHQIALADIDVFGVTVGPGSFTGLRVGLATVKGFAWALKKPIVELNSLEVLALSYMQECSGAIVPMIDARKGRVFSAAYRAEKGALHQTIPPCDVAVKTLLSSIPGKLTLLGSGSRTYRVEIETLAKERVTIASQVWDGPKGGALLAKTYEKARHEDYVSIESFEPVYLRPSEAELKEPQPYR